MAEGPDVAVLREALRQGERLLDLQDKTRESILRRAGELLRLAIASLGGIIVVAGILSAIPVAVDDLAFVGFGVAIILEVSSTGLLAAALAGGRTIGAFAYGPNLRRIVERLGEGRVSQATLLGTLSRAQPSWIEDNNKLMVRMQRMNAVAVTALGIGTLALLTTLFYILGGAILG